MSQLKNDVVLIKHTHATRSNDAIALVDPLADPSAKNIKQCQKTTLDSFVVKKQPDTVVKGLIDSSVNKPFSSSVNVSPDSSAQGDDLLSFKSPAGKVLTKSFSSSTPHLKTNFFASALHNVSTAISHFVAPPVDTLVASNLSINVDLNASNNSPPGPSPPIIVVTAPNVVQPNNSDSDSEDDLGTVYVAANPLNTIVLGGGTSGLGASASLASSTVSLIIEGDDSDEMANSLTPERFSGLHAENPTEFLEDAESFFAYRKLTEPEKIGAFSLLLKGPAKYWYSSLADKSTYNGISAAFKTQFASNSAITFRDMASVVAAKQLPEESVELYMARVQKLAKKAGATEDQLRFSLVNGFKSSVRQHVLTSQADTFDKIRTAALIAEGASVDEHDATNNLLKSIVSRLDKMEPRPFLPQQQKKRTFTPKNHGQTQTTPAATPQQWGGTTYYPQTQRRPQPQSGESSISCYKCGKQGGHRQGEACRAATATCYNCQKMGHFGRVCRGAKQGTNGAAGQRRQPQQPQQPQQQPQKQA